MGMIKITFDSFIEAAGELKGKKIIELGDQMFFFKEWFVYEGVQIKFFKNYCDLIGVQHTSIDIHGGNGVLPLDFQNEVPYLMKGRYDILTNFGFVEHVPDQYAAWKNIHDLVKVGGIIINELPGQPDFPFHQSFPYFTTTFFERFADLTGCEILINRFQQHDIPQDATVVFSSLKKTKKDFITKEQFKTIYD